MFLCVCQEKPEQKVKVGQIWVWKSNVNDPFLESTQKLKIIDIKAGWVKYKKSNTVNQTEAIENLLKFYCLYEDV